MDQKRILWIVASVGIFLLVVIGAALILYAPSRNTDPVLASMQNRGGYQQSGNGYPIPTEPAPLQTTPKEYTPGSTQTGIQNDFSSSIPATAKDITVIAENATVYSDKSVYANNPSAAQPLSGTGTFGAAGTGTASGAVASVATETPAQIQIKVQPATGTASQEVSSVTPITQPAKAVPPAKKPAAQTSAAPAKKAPATAAAPKKAAAAPAKSAARYWVQAASFGNKKNAEDARALLAAEKMPGEIFTYTDAAGKMFYRVRVGPYTTESEAEYWKTRIKMIDQFSSTACYVTNTSQPLSR